MHNVHLALNLLDAMKQGYKCWAEYVHHVYQFYCGDGTHDLRTRP